jgi:hypothetical protein
VKRVLARFLLAAALALLAACSATRVAYNNADSALRYMAWEYLDLESEQSGELKVRIARLHEWHRANELPAYAVLMRSAAQRVARGVEAGDVAWAIAGLRARYRRFASRAAEDAAPVLATLGTDQLAHVEKKFAERNAKYAKEFFPRDEKELERAQLKRALERFSDWTGALAPEQEARIARFVREHRRYAVLRFEDRQRWQHDAIALIRQYRRPDELGPRIAEVFTEPQRRRPEEFAREEDRWEADLAQLLVDLDRTLSPGQRAHAVERMQGYAEDFTALAAAKGEAA